MTGERHGAESADRRRPLNLLRLGPAKEVEMTRSQRITGSGLGLAALALIPLAFLAVFFVLQIGRAHV